MSKITHTCGYKVGFDREIQVSGESFYVNLDASVEFDNEAEAKNVEITECTIENDKGETLSWDLEGRQLERVVVKNYPDLTSAIDNTLWAEIETYASDNYSDIAKDIDEDYEMARAEWFRD
jgi:hypothetical protein